MSKALKLILFVTVLFVTTGVANAQQYGIGRFERVQILANELEDTTRALYLREERQWPRVRGDRFVLRVLYRLHNQAANFQNQVQRNFHNPNRIDLEYRRLSSTLQETQYTLNGMPRTGYLYRDLQLVANLTHQLGRSMHAGGRYRDRDIDRYDNDPYDEYDDYDRDYDDDDYDDDDD